MAEPSNPHSILGENPEPSSLVAAEEETEGNAPGENLPVLRWSKSSLEILMRDIHMPPSYGAIYPQEGDTAGDAPAGYVTMFADFFGVCNLRFPLTVFVAEVLKWLPFRNVTDSIITENIGVPRADTVEWFPNLWIIGWFKLDNTQLWMLRMMLGRMSRNALPVVREKSGEDAPLWRMFCSGFKGKVVVLPCEDGEEGFNRTIRDNFRVPDPAALKVELPQGIGDLGALGDPTAAGVPKQHMEKHGDKRFHKSKKPHEPVIVPPLVPEVAGISRTRLRKYDDYVVVSDPLEGLGVLGGSATAGGSSVGVKPVDDKKMKGDAPAVGGQKGSKLRRT
ncbi:hypothetical protein HanPSC8_Chr05g0205801 [Helianthus annuus]|nr:hypothetical protein HanPSC8_Chr05g0205801 [Helianthus annuus]